MSSSTSTSPWLRGAFHEIGPGECGDLLRQRDVGRIAFWGEDGPTVLPVNYVVDSADGSAPSGVRLRTSAYSQLAQQVGGSVVAFEVDETDDFTRSGWSVLLRGTAEVLLGPQPGAEPEPWAEGVRTVTVRVPATTLTGRRVLGH